MTTSYRAPFSSGGSQPIDPETARKLLSTALSAGGDYADLYFEYTASGSFSYEEGILKSAGRGVGLGLGVRVIKGDATGYAYTESLTAEAMANAAKTAGQIAAGGGAPEVPAPEPKTRPDRYPVERLTLDIPGVDKRQMLRRADQAARAYDPRIMKVMASFTEEIREVLIATSDGIFVEDRRPLLRFGVSAVAEDGALRQSGSSSGGGRMGFEYFMTNGKKPEDHGREAARIAIDMLDAKEAPAGELPVVLAPGDSGILLHEAVGHGLEADFNRKKTSNYSDRVGELVASELVSVVDDPTYLGARGAINVDDEGNDAKPVSLIEQGVLRAYLQDRTSAKHFECFEPPRSTAIVSVPPDAAHDQHDHDPRTPYPRGDHRQRQKGRLRQAILGRPGQHLQRRLRFLAHRELLDRRRKTHGSSQGGQPDRQWAGRSMQGRHARRRRGNVRRHVDLRKRRAVGPSRSRLPHDPNLGHHGRRNPGGLRRVMTNSETVAALVRRAERVVEDATSKGAEVAEVLARDSQELSVKVRLGERELVEEAGSSALGLRVIKDGKSALTYTSDMTDDGLQRVVLDALELAALSEPDPDAVPPDASELMRDAPPDLDLHDPSGAKIDGDRATSYALSAEQAARDYDPKITNSDGATYSRTWGASALVTSGGFKGGYEGTYQSLVVSPLADDAGGKKRNGFYWDARRHVDRMADPAEIGKEAARRTLAKLGAEKVPTCEVPVVFDPDAGRALLGLLFSCLAGSAIYKRTSYLVDAVGEPIASDLVNIVDDPLIKAAPGSRPFDGEGLASRKNTVVDGGVLKTFLLDTYSARKLGLKSTASASRGIGGRPSPSSTNFHLLSGGTRAEEIVKGVDAGLYVTGMMGFGFNGTTGDFSRGAEGFWIEKGELTKPVGEITISANFKDLWKRIDAVGDDLDPKTGFACPTFRVSRMTVAGS